MVRRLRATAGRTPCAEAASTITSNSFGCKGCVGFGARPNGSLNATSQCWASEDNKSCPALIDMAPMKLPGQDRVRSASIEPLQSCRIAHYADCDTLLRTAKRVRAAMVDERAFADGGGMASDRRPRSVGPIQRAYDLYGCTLGIVSRDATLAAFLDPIL